MPDIMLSAPINNTTESKSDGPGKTPIDPDDLEQDSSLDSSSSSGDEESKRESV